MLSFPGHGSEAFVEVTLEGGPDKIPRTARLPEQVRTEGKVKIPHYGGYEHFELVPDGGEVRDGRALLFRWTQRTEAAE